MMRHDTTILRVSEPNTDALAHETHSEAHGGRFLPDWPGSSDLGRFQGDRTPPIPQPEPWRTRGLVRGFWIGLPLALAGWITSVVLSLIVLSAATVSALGLALAAWFVVIILVACVGDA